MACPWKFFLILSLLFLDSQPCRGEENESDSSSVAVGGRMAPFWQVNYVNGVVAVVNDRVITAGELRQELMPLMPRIEGAALDQADFDRRVEEAARQVLDEMIDRALVVQDFEKSGNRIPEMQKNFQLDEFIRNRFGGDRMRFMDKLHDYGKSLQRFKREMEEGFIVDWMLGRIRQSRTEISPSQVRDYYDEHPEEFLRGPAVRTAQLQFRGEDHGGVILARERAEKVLERMRNGEELAALREEFGGEAGPRDGEWIPLSALRRELADEAKAASVGAGIGPIADGENFIVVAVLEKREEYLASLEEVQDEIEGRLLFQRVREAQERWLEELRRAAYVKIYL
jgi:peptidyl-prolyl cis-trans isomerase SurA